MHISIKFNGKRQVCQGTLALSGIKKRRGYSPLPVKATPLSPVLMRPIRMGAPERDFEGRPDALEHDIKT
jgi:hypothetical protein